MAQKSIFGKTYSKASKKPGTFSSFDEALKIPGSMNLKATSKITKWGTLKFTKNGENLDSRKRVFNEDDPFSFEPDKKTSKVVKLSLPVQPSYVSEHTNVKSAIESDKKYEENSEKLNSKSKVGPAGASLEAFMQALNKNGDTTKKITETTTNHKIFKSRNKSKENFLKDKPAESNERISLKGENDSKTVEKSIFDKDIFDPITTTISSDVGISHDDLSDNEVNAKIDEEKDIFTFLKKDNKKPKVNNLIIRKETKKQTVINDFLNKEKSEALLNNNNDIENKKDKDEIDKFDIDDIPHPLKDTKTPPLSIISSSSIIKSSSSPILSSSYTSSSSCISSSSHRKFLTGETKYKSKYKARRWWEQTKIDDEKEEKTKNEFMFDEEEDVGYDEDKVIEDKTNSRNATKKDNGGLDRGLSSWTDDGNYSSNKGITNNNNNNNNENKNNNGDKNNADNEDSVFKKPSTSLFFKTKYGLQNKKNNKSVINLDKNITYSNNKSNLNIKNNNNNDNRLRIFEDEDDDEEDVLKDKVIRDVKQAHECHESGESQEFKDDLDYLMDGLAIHQAPSIRCLSLLSLLSKCKMASFRMHLRAHAVPSRIFPLLNLPLTQALELCSSCLFLFITSDRLSTDLDQSSFSLLLKLIQSKPPTLPAPPTNKKPSFFKSKLSKSTTNNNNSDNDKDYVMTRDKIYDICSSSSSSSSSKNNKSLINNLTLQKTTTALIGTEALVRYLSKKDVKLHRDLLLHNGGLKIIISKVCEHINTIDSSNEYDVIKSTLDDLNVCLHALENISHQHEGCKGEMVEDVSLLDSMCGCVIKCCDLLGTKVEGSEDGWVVSQLFGRLDKSSPGYCLFVCLLASLNVFINLSHDHRSGSEKVGQCRGLVDQLLRIVLILQLNNNNNNNKNNNNNNNNDINNTNSNNNNNNNSNNNKDNNNNNNILSSLVNTTQLHTLPSGCKFDLAVLSLGLLINIVEDCDPNIERLLEAKINNNNNNNDNVNHDNNKNHNDNNKCKENKIPQSLETLSFLFNQAYNAARDFEEEHDAELERKRPTLPEEEDDHVNDERTNENVDDDKDGDGAANVSGEWVESELGVEWVARDCKKQQSSKQAKQLSSKTAAEPLVQDVNKALRKAGKHMEDTILAAYSALLIGCILLKKPELIEGVRVRVAEKGFRSLSRMITKIYNFMNITQGIKPSTSKSILKVLNFLETIQ